MKPIRHSLPGKIILAILIVEIVLLTVMGVFYSSRFNREIDKRITEKLALPGVLMNQRALPYDSVQDFGALSDLVQEKVVEAFIFQQGGTIFFTADPTKEGRLFTDFLAPEERGRLGADLDKVQQASFTAEDGRHFLSNVTPLLADGHLLGGLYVKMSADAIEDEKQGVELFFWVGALLAIALTTLVEAFVVHRLFVPRIVNASTSLKKYADGDFSARIDHVGDPDQFGQLMQQVNSLLETVEEYTRKLQALNSTGEVFARLVEKKEILRVGTETVERQLPVRAIEKGEDDRGSLFFLPVYCDSSKTGGSVIRFSGIADYRELSAADASFVYTLSGLMESALERIESFQKITEAEEKYRYLFLLALEGIFRSTPDGALLDANPALATMRGYDSVEDMIRLDKDIRGCYEDLEERRKIMQLLANEGKVLEYEVNMRRKDGSIFPASLSARAVRNPQGEIESIEGRIIDISERRQREQEKREKLAVQAVARAKALLVEDLEKKNKQLQEALDELKCTQLQLVQSEKMAAVGMTAGGVAHDLNNILAGVVSYPELLLATLPADSEMRGPLAAILASGRRAVAVVADLLTLAQGSARVKKNVLLDSLVEEYLQSVEFREMMRGYPEVRVSSVCQAEGICINCSPVHIQKVIMNLVMNAVEALASTGGSVNLETRLVGTDPEGKENSEEYAVLEVHDSGPGIPPENRGHIFEPFYTRKVMGKKGTGLGLTVVWNVVREHEGRIELDCDAPGTTFRVLFPARKAAVPDGAGGDAGADLGGRGRLLVVDDEPLQRDIAEKMLTIYGYEVQSVASGEAAVALLRDQSVDLVILDMLMPPGMNGLQTYRGILGLHPGQKAILVSGFSEDSDVKMAMRLGVGGFVKKPYSMAQIARAVKDELARVPAGHVSEG